jgi:hypothetical protein
MLLSLPIDTPIQLNLSLDHRVFVFAVALAVVATLACGLLPAWRATGVGVASALKGESPATKRFRLRHALLVAQAALSLTLRLSAGLFLRSMARMQISDPGFTVQNHLYNQVAAPAETSTPNLHEGQYAKSTILLVFGCKRAVFCCSLLGGRRFSNACRELCLKNP